MSCPALGALARRLHVEVHRAGGPMAVRIAFPTATVELAVTPATTVADLAAELVWAAGAGLPAAERAGSLPTGAEAARLLAGAVVEVHPPRGRAALLEAGAFTLAAVAVARGLTPEAAQAWAEQAAERGDLFTVRHGDETLVPAFLLDGDLDPRPEYTGSVAAATADGWALWEWFVLPSAALGGRVPAEHALAHPDLVARAAANA